MRCSRAGPRATGRGRVGISRCAAWPGLPRSGSAAAGRGLCGSSSCSMAGTCCYCFSCSEYLKERQMKRVMSFILTRERDVLFNDALNIFYLRLYGVRHMVKNHSDSEKGNPLPPHRLLLLINSKGSFICTREREREMFYLTTHSTSTSELRPAPLYFKESRTVVMSKSVVCIPPILFNLHQQNVKIIF